MDESRTEHKYVEEVLFVNELTVDPRVQRSNLREQNVRHIVNHFNPDALGVITVSRRKDRSHIILDGQHRTEAVRRRTNNSGTVPCHVFNGLTLAEEALMFLDLNQGDKPSLIDKYRVRVTAGDPAACLIDQMVRSAGYAVTAQAGDGSINAVQALERLHQLSVIQEADPHLIQLTLAVISDAWGDSRFGLQAAVLTGVGRVIGEHGARVDLSALSTKLRDYKGGPQNLVASARQLGTLRQVNTAMAVAELIIEEYNKGKTRNALPRWAKRT
jgi:hypothetical protein